MSFLFPETGIREGTGQGLRLDLPAGIATKPTNTGFTVMFFFRTRGNYRTSGRMAFLTRGSGTGQGQNGGNNGMIFYDSASAAQSLNWRLMQGGSDFFANITRPVLGRRTYLAVLSVTNTGKHMILAEPNGSYDALFEPHNANNPWVGNLGGTDLITGIGAGQNTSAGAAVPWVGPMENVCMWHGCLPETATNQIDQTLIQNIANGTQSLDTVHLLMDARGSATPVSRRFRYPLTSRTDFAEVWNTHPSLTIANTDSAIGRVALTGGNLLPQPALSPALVGHTVSQVVFTRPTDSTSAFADILIEGGTYSGISPTRIEARLLSETGTVVRDWTTVDAAPSGGVWRRGTLFDVPMTAGWLQCEFRAMTGVSTVLASAPSFGLKAAGFNIITQGQSQLTGLYDQVNPWGYDLASQLRGVVHQVNNNGWRGALLSAGTAQGWGNAFGGIAHAYNEINAFFPGVPIAFNTVGEQGTMITAYFGSGVHAGRWALLRDGMGLVQPYILMLVGHSTGTESDYSTNMQSLIAYASGSNGLNVAPMQTIVASTFRYRSGPQADTEPKRDQQRSFVAANSTVSTWPGSWSSIQNTNEATAGGSDAHSDNTENGKGRAGGMLGWAVMSATRAVHQRPMGFVQAKANGTTAIDLIVGQVSQ